MEKPSFQQRLDIVNEGLEEPVSRPIEKYNYAGLEFEFGERVKVVVNDEDNGVYRGDEGYLVIEMVGAPEYRNERVKFSLLLIDEYDSTVDIGDPMTMLEQQLWEDWS